MNIKMKKPISVDDIYEMIIDMLPEMGLDIEEGEIK